MGALAVELHAGGARDAQRVGELGVEARRPAELGEQLLGGVVEPAPQRPGVAPDRLGGHPQARVLGGLQRELEPEPGLALGVVHRVAQVVDDDLGEPERAPRGAGVRGADHLPAGEPGVEGAGGGGVEEVRGDVDVDEPVAGLGVDEGGEGLGDDVDGVGPGAVAQRAAVEGLGADRGWERDGERVGGDQVAALQDGPPAEGVVGIVPVGGGQDAAAGDEVGGEPAERAQDLELRTFPGERFGAQEHTGVELEDGHGPRGERHFCCKRSVVACIQWQ